MALYFDRLMAFIWQFCQWNNLPHRCVNICVLHEVPWHYYRHFGSSHSIYINADNNALKLRRENSVYLTIDVYVILLTAACVNRYSLFRYSLFLHFWLIFESISSYIISIYKLHIKSRIAHLFSTKFLLIQWPLVHRTGGTLSFLGDPFIPK